MGRLSKLWLAALACVALSQGIASAQTSSAIAGVVKDAQGSVMPGVHG